VPDRAADKSIAYFEKALSNRQYASPSKALNNAGMCSLRMKNMPQAEKYLARAFQLAPGDPDVNLNLAKFYVANDDPKRGQFYVRRVISAERLTADSLWTAIRIERRAGDKLTEAGLANQLRRRFPNSPEYASYLRGAFNE